MQAIAQYSRAMLEHGVDPQVFAVLMAMATLSGKHDRGHHSHATIAKHLKRSRTWVCGVLTRAREEYGDFIEIWGHSYAKGGRSSNRYRLKLPCQPADTPRQPADMNQPNTTEDSLSSERTSKVDNEIIPQPKEVPPDWQPSEEDRAIALRERPDLSETPEVFDRMTLRFVHKSRANDIRYRDISEGWRSWVPIEWGPDGKTGGKKKTSEAKETTREKTRSGDSTPPRPHSYRASDGATIYTPDDPAGYPTGSPERGRRRGTPLNMGNSVRRGTGDQHPG